MLETIRHIIKKFALILPEQIVVVAVSGGADSMALLHVLHQLAPRMGFYIHAATFNHHLRGTESEGDVDYVRRTCAEWRIALSVGEANVRQFAAQHKLGLESAARVTRYNFLARTADEVGGACVALAHHADDQAETVLMHLLRGAGVTGAAGMAMRTMMAGHPDHVVIRPLLDVPRSSIELYCQEQGIAYRHDSSNDDPSILRNAIRLNVLPVLEGYSPPVRKTLARFAALAAVENDFMVLHVRQFVDSDMVRAHEGNFQINRAAFRALHPAIQRRVLVWMVEQVGQLDESSAQLILEAVETGLRGKQGAVALLGGGVRLRVEYAHLWVEGSGEAALSHGFPLVDAGTQLVISCPSASVVGKYRLWVGPAEPAQGDDYCQLCVPVAAALGLRTRRPGDRFAPAGLDGHTQKLSRWLVNAQIPQKQRDHIPLITIDEEIAAFYINQRWVVSETFVNRNTACNTIYFQFLENS